MSEHDEQVAIFEWAAMSLGVYPELELLYAIPNGAKLPYKKNARGGRYSREAFWLLREGLKPGVPDMCLPVARSGYHGLYVELKHDKNKPTDKQEWWIDALNTQGYLSVAVWEAEAAIELITNYLEGKLA